MLDLQKIIENLNPTFMNENSQDGSSNLVREFVLHAFCIVLCLNPCQVNCNWFCRIINWPTCMSFIRLSFFCPFVNRDSSTKI